ncbi:selenide, water dikinase SelD [Ralstonia wenshanensis]|uniref:selenide, water dikinase SelD n=1 Tax=Ralstonia wenshanensis TaxID=2842456 RepID=UPI001E296E10|nr:selenide, water dikinase SelD [Ralstonia wenshanensis]UGS91261.1 selenide, water dikinase SelD [Ralstonia wenshanensis]
MRFIDLATDGGCSKKAPASDLENLLDDLVGRAPTAFTPDLNIAFPDSGRYSVGGTELLATVDVLFPMVPEPEDFGRVVVNHVLGDIYASFGTPKFALAHLGVPYGMDASSGVVTRMMTGALAELSDAGVTLVGGHTLAKQTDLSLGFSIVGTPVPKNQLPARPPRPGDPLFLTKPLGSSVASILWKTKAARDDELRDVITEGVLKRSAAHTDILHKSGIEQSTDVTGFGLVNHAHRLLLRQGVAAQITVEALPIYSSLVSYLDSGELPTTSLYFDNVSFAEKFSNAAALRSHPRAPLLFDAQVAGGLVFTLPAESSSTTLRLFEEMRLTAQMIGHCIEGPAGKILLV